MSRRQAVCRSIVAGSRRILLVAVAGLAISIPARAETGNAVCAKCHGAITRAYAQTGMAKTSGKTAHLPKDEAFRQEAVMGATVSPAFVLQLNGASRSLEWFLGSGHVGRSYLFRKGAQLFQSPLSYYSVPQKWDVSPGYETKPYLEMTRAVETACLQCHASRIQAPGSPDPFLQAGVGCERCHGAGERHAASPTRSNIVNPSRLSGVQRDSVCAQCHLTGAARIARAGQQRGSYAPGARLSDSLAVFVWTADRVGETMATSHMEKLVRSRCRQASGDKLWCGTCHQLHAEPTAQNFNEKCQFCHVEQGCTAKARTSDNCVECHMPKRRSGPSTEHIAFTDHAIPRGTPAPSGAAAVLREFWTGEASVRDTAMAYAVATAGDATLQPEAYRLLQAAAAAHPEDPAVLGQLAQFHDNAGKEEEAAKIYERILLLDPANTAAAVNLGIVRIREGRAREAMALWLRALARNPALIGARMNLAVAQFQAGDAAAARRSLQAVLDYEPGHPVARRMMEQLP